MTIHVQEADVVRDFAKLMEHVRAGDRVELERAGEVIAVLHQPEDAPLRGRTAHEMIAILKAREEQGHPPALMDEAFAADVREGHELMNQPLEDGKWD
ncbi:hypothetical protein [Terriglobus saanensis]|uniref:Prevent-host-death family protein n=1 Tax=Terriglobus saanensis (strain ATCC BAA-1853 / DSM 23119 / SP1PR4) TaxID=401053 RepID=E8V4K8_TERSS|nr:hypothetical protein [Terriglobus saanensis]ADV84832.1 hypothetical protein AciPR4_4084 [Terriglobus saanensis SP1PR4]